MDIDKKRELKGYVSLCDQAIAPLTNLKNYIETTMANEINWLDNAENQDDDAIVTARDKATDLEQYVESLGNTLLDLNALKQKIEAY